MHTWLSLDVAVADVIHQRQHEAAADAGARQHLAALRATANRTSERRRTGPRYHAALALRWLGGRLDPTLASERHLEIAPSGRS
jgi:hypothetical protein